jgi:MYXO-CTERM domain-containing protein
MRRPLALSLLGLLVPVAASAGPRTIEGHVVEATGRYTEDGSRIVTEARVRTADGTEVTVSQLGGTVDGLTMRQWPGPEPLLAGMRVAVATHDDTDLDNRAHLVVDDVRVLAMPPGFVRTGPTKGGKSLFWESGCVFLVIDADGTKHLPGETELPLIDQAIATWNTAGAGCSYLQLKKAATAKHEVGKDYTNVIKFRDMSWCRPKIKDDPARCYSEAAAGITTAVFVDDPKSARDGAIVDADIELNGVNFAISNNGVTLGIQSCKAELLNTLTHELGHLQGMEHTCRVADDPPRVDDLGRPVPLCTQTSDPEIIDATMYPFQDCSETKKQSLEPDDIDFLCKVYPKADDPGTCAEVEPSKPGCGGCASSAPGSPLGPLALTAVTTVWLLRRRRGIVSA